MPLTSMEVAERVRKLRTEGQTIWDLSTGEPDGIPPIAHINFSNQLSEEINHKYTDTSGSYRLRQLIANKYVGKSKSPVSPENVIVTTGAKQAIFAALWLTIKPGDEVIICVPYWPTYATICRYFGANVVFVMPETSRLSINIDGIRNALSANTRWVIVNTPNNPSGCLITPVEWSDLVGLLKEHPQACILSDEVYEKIFYPGKNFESLSEHVNGSLEHCLIVSGFSKSYALTGWRLGYAIGDIGLIKKMTSAIAQITTCPPAISQAVAVELLSSGDAYFALQSRKYYRRALLCQEYFSRFHRVQFYLPDGAFYFFPDISGWFGSRHSSGMDIKSAEDVVECLLVHHNVAIVSGAAYGMPTRVRISFAVDDGVLEEALIGIDCFHSQLDF